VVPKGIQDLLDAIITSDDISSPKPNPETFMKASDAIGTIPNKCIVVCDSLNDFLAAKDAGMSFILLRTTYNKGIDIVQYCNHIIDDLSELQQIFT